MRPLSPNIGLMTLPGLTVLFFFFQAEDGIRDRDVTGVQTCALPISIKFDRAPHALVEQAIQSMRTLNRAGSEALRTLPAAAVHACTDITGFGLAGLATEMARASGVTLKIGRASCRERV